MNKSYILYCAIGVITGACTGSVLAQAAINALASLERNKFARCPIENSTKERLSIKVVRSKFTTGTYFIEPKGEAVLSCGDAIEVYGEGGSVQKITLQKPTAIHFAEKKDIGSEI